MTFPVGATDPLGIRNNEQEGAAFGFAREGYGRAEIHDLSTADLEDATVYGRGDETIGSIRSLKIDADGRISGAVIDVGGFLGLGAHSVLVPFDGLTVLRETDGSDVRVHLDTTKDKLKAMRHHTG
ncbi:MAG: PRC-barrel domain-containing protein [Hoeflea sp.]|uniref:PRC-barrel domain-containing protein n=1 Tax=Hoeflea sp. TaxID=1940281 RepID=UPI0027321121|nr:PRC-barrel domain-containing protein [Hoeflea sp.]MDP2121657.1 PRC-barrel domain-containing protein [Hoeflea sp.]